MISDKTKGSAKGGKAKGSAKGGKAKGKPKGEEPKSEPKGDKLAHLKPEYLQHILALKQLDTYEYGKVRDRLRDLGCSLTLLDDALKGVEKEYAATEKRKEREKARAEAKERAAKHAQPNIGPDGTGRIHQYGNVRQVTTLKNLNARYALLEAEDGATVYINRVDASPISKEALSIRLAPEVVKTGVNKETGEPSYTPAYEFWTKDARRHVYRRIAFTNGQVPDDTHNLYKGLGVTPKEGDCSKLLQHILEVICSSNQASYKALLDLQAWQIQKIGQPSRVIVGMKSKKHQAGKGLLLEEVLFKIYGPKKSAAKPIKHRTADRIIQRHHPREIIRVPR